MNDDNIIFNKINYNYFIKDKYEAGIVLHGWEVKSLRSKSVQIINSYITLKKNELWLLGLFISPLKSTCNHVDIISNRKRKLLLKKKEIRYLSGIIIKKGYTLLPSKIYLRQSIIKVQICVCVGKTKFDKRDIIKEREIGRKVSIVFKQYNII